jgi:NAD(P)-dependent dehydrogenase (short-subunit alcohol dehydrogenase family)
MAFPHYTNIFHTSPYPSIDPSRPELSTAGKVVFITGGGSGLGARLSHAFAKSGSTKIAIIGRTESTLLSTKKAVEAQHPGVSVLAITADISDQTTVNAAFVTTKNAFGPVDILVSNAGNIPDILPLATSPIEEFTKGFEVNVKGSLIVAQAFLANAADSPILINVGTAGAHIGALHTGMGAYNISKLAAVKMLDYIAAGSPHVRTVTVHPGVIDTAMNKKCNEAGLVLPLDDSESAVLPFDD